MFVYKHVIVLAKEEEGESGLNLYVLGAERRTNVATVYAICVQTRCDGFDDSALFSWQEHRWAGRIAFYTLYIQCIFML